MCSGSLPALSTLLQRHARSGRACSRWQIQRSTMAVLTFQILFTFLAVVFLGAGVALPVLELTPLPLAWLACLWPGLVYAVIAVVYFLPWSWHPEAVFCKSHTTGRIPVITQILMAPFLVPMWTLWWLRHKMVLAGLEDPNNLVHDGLHVGRFPLHYDSEFPTHVQNVVDLTCEFPASSKVTSDRQCVTRLVGKRAQFPHLSTPPAQVPVRTSTGLHHVAARAPSCCRSPGAYCLCHRAVVLRTSHSPPTSLRLPHGPAAPTSIAPTATAAVPAWQPLSSCTRAGPAHGGMPSPSSRRAAP